MEYHWGHWKGHWMVSHWDGPMDFQMGRHLVIQMVLDWANWMDQHLEYGTERRWGHPMEQDLESH